MKYERGYESLIRRDNASISSSSNGVVSGKLVFDNASWQVSLSLSLSLSVSVCVSLCLSLFHSNPPFLLTAYVPHLISLSASLSLSLPLSLSLSLSLSISLSRSREHSLPPSLSVSLPPSLSPLQSPERGFKVEGDTWAEDDLTRYFTRKVELSPVLEAVDGWEQERARARASERARERASERESFTEYHSE